MSASRFLVIATPIGNLEDITLRALRELKLADIILCEDTRVTKKLLSHYQILDKPLMRFDEHAKDFEFRKVGELLEEGKNLALVTDAGTPAISDPGVRLLSFLRERFTTEECSIEAIPGASALTASLSISGFPTEEFVFLGFPPHKKGRETFFKNLLKETRTVVFYESPHRLIKALEALRKVLPEERRMAVARELTKMHEEFIQGTGAEVETFFLSHPDKVRGECVVIISPTQ